jgi:ribose 5-phosphate isomerase A
VHDACEQKRDREQDHRDPDRREGQHARPFREKERRTPGLSALLMGVDLEEQAKRAVGRRAVDAFVRDGSCIGLGTGSTARYAIERVGERVREGWDVRVVPTSIETEHRCREYGVTLRALADEPIEVAIDGADEVAPDWALIKGGGGALFREKAVAIAARVFVVIVTERKLVDALGAFPLPVEVVPFSARYVVPEIEALGAQVRLRQRDGTPLLSDNGNTILDCRFGPIYAPAELDAALRALHGVVATGLFIGLAAKVLVAKNDGTIEQLERPGSGR